MKKYTFKTTINCNNCLSKVQPVLDAEDKIENWKVDLTDPDRILTVQTATLSPEQVSETVQKAGFSAEPIKK